MLEGQAPRFVSAAEITRNFGMWQDRAGQGPLVVTHHGRPRCVLLSAESYRAITEEGDDGARRGDGARDAIEHALLAERLEAGLIELDGSLGITRANSMAALLLGRPADMLAGRALADVAPTLASGLPAARLRRTVRDGEEARFDCPVADGTALSVHAFPWPAGAALLLRRIGAGEEEDARAGGLALDDALVAHGGVGVVSLTVRGTIARASDAFAALSGFAPVRLVGVRATDLMALAARATLADAVERVLTGCGVQAIDSRLLVNGGDERPVRIALAPIASGLAIGGAAMVVTATG